jgi:hypothetical protein
MNIRANNFIPDFSNGETQVVFQRHSNYDREEGVLLETEKTISTDNSYFNALLSNLTEEEKHNLYILFIASNTTGNNGLMRAYDTTEIARTIAENKFTNNGISNSNIINNSFSISNTKKDINLKEPNMFIDDTGYFQYLKNKYGGVNKDFWIAFEEDIEKQYRLSVFGEGPDEIVDRALNYLNFMKRYSDFFHEKNTNSRLIIWSGTHYDLISPLIKQLVLKLDKKETVAVDYNGGIAINIDKDGKFLTSIDGIYHDLGDLDNVRLHRHF